MITLVIIFGVKICKDSRLKNFIDVTKRIWAYQQLQGKKQEQEQKLQGHIVQNTYMPVSI